MIEVRSATISDIEQLSKLFDSYRIFYEKQSDIPKAKEFLTDRILNNESQIFVVDHEIDGLCGFVQLYPVFSSTRMQRMWLLNDLFVEERYRGHGISVELINKSKQFCTETKASGLLLETSKTNEIGNNLYYKTEFELDIEHNYYFWDSQIIP